MRQCNKGLERLMKVFLTSDQKDRMQKSKTGILETEDRVRYALAKVVLSGRRVRKLSARNLYVLAMVLHHAGDATDLFKARLLAERAATRGYTKARWLWAALFDRRQVLLGRPQRYGTQFRLDRKRGKLQLIPTDGRCSDAERIQLGLPTLSEITESFNQLSKDDLERRKNLVSDN